MSDALVVGAGPVGLFMASELARHGISCRIIDKLSAPSRFCRALGVTPRTLEIWEDMGIVNEAIDAGIWIEGMRLEVEGAPSQDFKADFSDLPFSPLALPQYETEEILMRHLARFGLHVERGVTLARAVQEREGVSVTLDRGVDDAEEVSFRYVIGCDGAHSTVRRAAEIGFPGKAMPYDFMLGDVRVEWDLLRGFTLRSMRPVKDSAPDIFVAVPLPEVNRYRITMLASPDLSASSGATDHGIQSERPAPSLAHLQEAADRILPKRVQLADLRWSSLFRVSMRLADHYRKGFLFLAGDAAHIHPPTGGQGMNTGIQDAYNLAWKLALVLKGVASPELLDSYETERRAEGADVVARTTQASIKIADRDAKPDRLADTQIRVSYRNSPWVRDDANGTFATAAPVSGDRAPDCQGLRRHGVGFPLRLFEVLRGTEHVLLVSAQTNPAQKVESLGELAESLTQKFGANFSRYLRIIAIGSEAQLPTPPPGVVYLSDQAKTFSQEYLPHDGSAFLVRPDGYIAWRGNDATNPKLIEYLGRFFLRPTP